VAGSGRAPVPLMRECVEILRSAPNIELLRPLTREVFNLVQAEEIGCHIITMTNDLISKIPLIGKDLDEFALDTVKMFARDSDASGYRLQPHLGEVFSLIHRISEEILQTERLEFLFPAEILLGEFLHQRSMLRRFSIGNDDRCLL
jgi:hypothetical protein